MNYAIQTSQTRRSLPREQTARHLIFNDETRRAIEEARLGIGLTKGYHSAAELFAALDAEEENVDG